MNHPCRSIFSLLLFFCMLPCGLVCGQQPVEYDTGRLKPAVGDLPALGAGLAMSGGYLRGVPVGELAGWTASLWFRADSEVEGDLFGLVFDAEKGDMVRLTSKGGGLVLSRKGKRGWQLRAKQVSGGAWHQVVLTYSQSDGVAMFLDGQRVSPGVSARLGYATDFNNYHFGAAVLEGGKFGHYFDGLIDDFELRERQLSPEEVAGSFRGEKISGDLVAFQDFENVSHRDLASFTASDRDEAYLQKGAELYAANCIACHSKDGIAPPPNPLSRHFSKHAMLNGGDPLSMFNTVTYGFRNMMPAVQLTPEQRYQVIHFIREKLVKENAPKLYVEVGENYTDAMPRKAEGSAEAAMEVEALARTGYLRDYGNALISPVVGGVESLNALTINLDGEATISYDLGTMRTIGAWTGGFLDFSNTLHHRLRAPALPTARFDFLKGADGWRWAWDGKAENEPQDLGTFTVWPEEQVRYRGHYAAGDDIIISYSVQGRGILEGPLVEKAGNRKVIHHRLTIEPGERALELVVGKVDAVLQGGAEGVAWREGESDAGEKVLKIPAAAKPIHINVVINPGGGDIEVENHVADLTELSRGGGERWKRDHEMSGQLTTGTFQGYAMDSLPVPLKNAYNSWMRTSALAFFPDGRLAVATLAGDVWIVSGIDKDLQKVTWKRFAAGLYEPMGMKVVDGVLTVGTRGRIVKLHDYDKDGEADFYEAFFNEREPSNGWHAYSFDLEVGDDGSFYYARVGGFSDWSVPGGIVRVSPDGKTSEVIGAGLRVPNGIGRLPDGRITFGDNQGTYVPAGKIAITKAGAFHGAGSWDKHKDEYDPETITDPIVYLPQELDSSCGAQLWVEKDERFGPLGGQYFHTSYGRARTMYVMIDEFGDTVQGAVFPLPLAMESGTLRVAKNPVDGQLYFSGLTGWQAGATREGSIQRLRFTGEDGLYVLDAKARKGQLELTFNRPVETSEIERADWAATAWNYRWSKGYGSPHFKVSNPEEQGEDEFKIESIDIDQDGKRVVVGIPELAPCHTLKLDFGIGGRLGGAVYFTIHELPASAE